MQKISDKWVNKGFCSMLLNQYGLVLDESNPMIKIQDDDYQKSFVYLNFCHVAFSVHDAYGIKMTVNS